MTQPTYARALTIADSDSGGGAALGCFGMSAITALTAQNTHAVTAIHELPAVFVRAQLDAVLDDIGVDAVKIGMLQSPDVIEAVADGLADYGINQVVLDPVMVAKTDETAVQWFEAERIESRNTHGAGCTLSSAIAAYLAHGLEIAAAVGKAKEYIMAAIRAGALYHLGQEHGPVRRFYAWWPQP